MKKDEPFVRFHPIDHTADLAFEARGRTLAELFESAALGMMAFLVDPSSVEPRETDAIEVEGIDREELLIGWLQEILYRLEVKGRIYRDFRVEDIQEPARDQPGDAAGLLQLRAEAAGERLEPSRHQLQTDIKAATYHGLKITSEDSPAGRLYVVRIVLDI